MGIKQVQQRHTNSRPERSFLIFISQMSSWKQFPSPCLYAQQPCKVGLTEWKRLAQCHPTGFMGELGFESVSSVPDQYFPLTPVTDRWEHGSRQAISFHKDRLNWNTSSAANTHHQLLNSIFHLGLTASLVLLPSTTPHENKRQGKPSAGTPQAETQSLGKRN